MLDISNASIDNMCVGNRDEKFQRLPARDCKTRLFNESIYVPNLQRSKFKAKQEIIFIICTWLVYKLNSKFG